MTTTRGALVVSEYQIVIFAICQYPNKQILKNALAESEQFIRGNFIEYPLKKRRCQLSVGRHWRTYYPRQYELEPAPTGGWPFNAGVWLKSKQASTIST